MQNWDSIRKIVTEILQQEKYKGSERYTGTPCFLTAYQIAVLVNEKEPSLRGTLPIGGAGVGPNSFAQQIARHLSDDFNKNVFNGSLEIQFLSLAGLDMFTFDGGKIPSTDEFSMFRLT